jgi:hypothetical protein
MAPFAKKSGSSSVSGRYPYTSLTVLDIPASSSVTDIRMLAGSHTKCGFSSGYGFGSAQSPIASKNALYCSIEDLSDSAPIFSHILSQYQLCNCVS